MRPRRSFADAADTDPPLLRSAEGKSMCLRVRSQKRRSQRDVLLAHSDVPPWNTSDYIYIYTTLGLRHRIRYHDHPGVLCSGFQLLPRTNSVALATTRLALPRSPPALKAALRALDAAVSHRYFIGISSVATALVPHHRQLCVSHHLILYGSSFYRTLVPKSCC